MFRRNRSGRIHLLRSVMGDELVRGSTFPFERVCFDLRANEVIENP